MGHRLDHGAHGREERLAHPLRVLAVRRRVVVLDVETEQSGDHGSTPLDGLGLLSALELHEVLDVAQQLVPGLFARVAIDDRGLRPDHLAKRPVDDSRSVREAAALTERRRDLALCEPPAELQAQPGLAHARLPDHRHEVRPALALDALVHGVEQLELVLAADERRLRGLPADRLRGEQTDRLPRRNGLGLALEAQRLELPILDRLARGAEGPLPHRHAPRPGRGLEPGGNVHRVADHRVSVADRACHDLAGVHPDAEREVHLERAGEALVDLAHRLLHTERRAHGALGVVLVGDRGAEDRHHVVADVLVDGAAVTVHLLTEPAQRPVDEALHGLRIHALRDRRVARQVRKHDRHLTALLGKVDRRAWWRRRRRWRCQRAGLEPGAARHAEARAGGSLRAA